MADNLRIFENVKAVAKFHGLARDSECGIKDNRHDCSWEREELWTCLSDILAVLDDDLDRVDYNYLSLDKGAK